MFDSVIVVDSGAVNFVTAASYLVVFGGMFLFVSFGFQGDALKFRVFSF